jgi:murein endopeptidase
MFLTLLALWSTAEADTVDKAETQLFASHQLPLESGLYYRWDPNRSWGQSVLVDTIRSASEDLAWILPDADPLLIGDVSRRGGGRMFGHRTHHAGTDVDIGLYTGEGEQPLGGFIDVRPTELDLAANWAVIRTLLNTDRVSFILLDQSHIDRLRAYLIEDLMMDASLVDPIFPVTDRNTPWDARGVVRHAPNHRSHLHVRIHHNAT